MRRDVAPQALVVLPAGGRSIGVLGRAHRLDPRQVLRRRVGARHGVGDHTTATGTSDAGLVHPSILPDADQIRLIGPVAMASDSTRASSRTPSTEEILAATPSGSENSSKLCTRR